MAETVIPDMVIHADDTGFYIGDRKVIAKFLSMNPSSLSTSNIFGLYAPDGWVSLIALPNVKYLWKTLRQVRRHQNVKADGGDQTVYLFMPCGYGRRYTAFDDLPWQDTRCPCGDPHHYLVRYSDPPAW